MKNKETTGEVDIVKDVAERMGDALGKFYDKALMEAMTAKSPFESDVEVEEVVPRWYVRVPVPYIGRSYDHEYGERNEGEWVFGFNWKTLFTIGKKKKKRFLMTWELPNDSKKHKTNTIKFKRYGDLSAESKPLDK